jgi:dihydroxy-acid dehydratase
MVGAGMNSRHTITQESWMAKSDKSKKPAAPSRSSQWFSRNDIYGFIYRSWTKNRGIPHDQFDGRPVIGICNTWSELTPCNSHFRLLADQVSICVL